MNNINHEELSEKFDDGSKDRPKGAAPLISELTPFEKEYAVDSGSSKDDTVALKLFEWYKDLGQREELTARVLTLATASFALLTVIVIFQMVVRLFSQEYQGASDTVINIIALSVFGQVLALIGALYVHLRKNNAKAAGVDQNPTKNAHILQKYEEEFKTNP